MKGIRVIAKNAGAPSVKSWKLIFVTTPSIRTPTTINAGEVAAPGIILTIPDRKKESPNNMEVENAARPVLPPSAIPAVHSRYVEVVVAPKKELITVVEDSQSNALFIFLTSPFSL